MVAVKQKYQKKNPVAKDRYGIKIDDNDFVLQLFERGKWNTEAIYSTKDEARDSLEGLIYDGYRIPMRVLHKQKIVISSKKNSVPTQNPHGFLIVDEHLNIKRRGADFDKLQNIVDKHDESHNEKWFVVDADDYKEAAKKRNNAINIVANPIAKITKAYIRRYADNNQTIAYVEWIDDEGQKGRTEGRPTGLHMKALLDRARREGVKVERQTWNGAAKRNATAADFGRFLFQIKDVSGKWVTENVYSNRMRAVDELESMVREGDKRVKRIVNYNTGKVIASSSPKRNAPNATAADFKAHQKSRLQDLAAMFQGTANGEKRRVLESDYAPKDKYRLGYLVQIKIKDGGKTIPINFDGESYLAGDLRNNLWVVGKDAKITNIKLPPKGQLKYLGELIQVDYVTAKKHIEGGKTVRFYHKLGEVTKETPNLFIDNEGFPIIVSGGYDVWDVGIVN